MIPFNMKTLLCALLTLPLLAATLPQSKPDEVGMSADRLKRIGPMIQSHIDAKGYSGAVTAVARKGKVVHFEAHGMADIEGNKPMKTDVLFRLASMTKPMTAVSILMLLEEGKLVLNDPISKFMPEWREAAGKREHDMAVGNWQKFLFSDFTQSWPLDR